jgi:hypothetical protein
MNPDHLWALVPAVGVVLLHLDTFAHDAMRVCAWLVERVGRVGAMWR